MQASVDPYALTSSPIRQLYEVLSIYEANRDWSKNARAALIEGVIARTPTPHQPDMFMFHSLLEELGMAPMPDLDISETEAIPGISLLAKSNSRPQFSALQPNQVTGGGKAAPKLTPQIANAMTTREMAAYAMLQLFGELSEQRIENWEQVARLIITQPMDGFATLKTENTSK